MSPASRHVRAVASARWVAIALAIAIVIVRRAPATAGARLVVITAITIWIGCSILITVGARRADPEAAARLGAAGLILDAVVVTAFAFATATDPNTTIWTPYTVLPIEGAFLYGLPGALGTWAAAAVLGVTRELYAATRGTADEPSAIAVRLGLLLLLAVAVGMMTRTMERRSTELADALERLEATEQWRAGLIGMLGHDIRSPLASVASSMRLLETSHEQVQDRIPELAGAVARQVDRLLNLTDDLLDMARSGTGRLELNRTSVDVAKLVGDVVASGDRPGDVEIVADGPVLAEVDERRVEQIAANLIGNALRHGRPPVQVSIRSQGRSGAVLTVVDRGVGIGGTQRETLFDAFRSGDGEGSIGLGLWVVAELARAHGGDAVYDTDPGGHPRFTVTLPGPDSSPAPGDA